MSINLDAWNNSLAGDVAYNLYQSNDANALIDWLDQNKAEYNTRYILAVVRCYDRMIEQGKDGRYGRIR